MITKQEAVSLIKKATKGEHSSDKQTMLKLAALIEKEENKKAYGFFLSMDTFVRDGIPENVRQYLYLKRCKTVKTIPMFVKVKKCKRVFDPSFPPGVIQRFDIDFPGDATESELSRWMLTAEDRALKETIEITVGEVKTQKS